MPPPFFRHARGAPRAFNSSELTQFLAQLQVMQRVLLTVTAANIASNTIEVTGPAWAFSTDDAVFFLPAGATAGAGNNTAWVAVTSGGGLTAGDVIDNLTTNNATKPLSAAQGVVLKGLIDAIDSLLASDDVSLDELQEIVDYIKTNRADLDALGIGSITGLQAALDAKAALVHTHVEADITDLDHYSQAVVDALLDAVTYRAMPTITETTTARVLAVTDAESYIRLTNAGGCDITIPNQATETWAADTEIAFRIAADASVTFTLGAGVTLNNEAAAADFEEHTTFVIKRVAENEWDLV